MHLFQQERVIHQLFVVEAEPGQGVAVGSIEADARAGPGQGVGAGNAGQLRPVPARAQWWEALVKDGSKLEPWQCRGI